MCPNVKAWVKIWSIPYGDIGALLLMQTRSSVLSLNIKHTIDEILQAVATDFADSTIYYTVDQLSGATITISSDPREITDKNGNVVRRIYKS